jgi:hypothetical protein
MVNARDVHLESGASFCARRQPRTQQTCDSDGRAFGNEHDAGRSTLGNHDPCRNGQNRKRKPHPRDCARAREIHRPPHPLVTPWHNRSRVCLAVVNFTPLVINRVPPTSFNFFSCHNVLQPPNCFPGGNMADSGRKSSVFHNRKQRGKMSGTGKRAIQLAGSAVEGSPRRSLRRSLGRWAWI